MSIWIGVAGMFLLVLGWVPQTIRTIREKKSGLDPRFSALYLLGSLLLAVYASSISDLVFLVLNLSAGAMAALGLYYGVKKR